MLNKTVWITLLNTNITSSFHHFKKLRIWLRTIHFHNWVLPGTCPATSIRYNNGHFINLLLPTLNIHTHMLNTLNYGRITSIKSSDNFFSKTKIRKLTLRTYQNLKRISQLTRYLQKNYTKSPYPQTT